MKSVVCIALLLGVTVSAVPVSQPVYPTTQFVSAQQIQQPIQLQAVARQPHIQYNQPQYLAQSPIYQQALPARNPPPPPPPPQNPPVGITQLLLPSAADRQVQKAAHNIAGPDYAQQVQSLQLQGLAAQAQLAAQRRAQVTAQRQIQQYRQLAQAQPQYLQEVQSAKPQLQLAAAQPQVPLQLQAQAQAQAQAQQPEDDYDHNPSYQFGFDVKDDYYTNYQNRKEQREGDKISGSYSVVDSDGFLRTVSYTADPKEGFKAEVNRQPTDIVVKIPKPVAPQIKQQQYVEEVPVDRGQLQGQKQRYVLQYQ